MAGDRRPLSERLFARTAFNKVTGCVEWTGQLEASGYGLIRDQYKRERTHRFAWRIAKGPIPDGKQVLHRCDNPRCVKVEHLFLGTALENIADKVAKGRQARGEQHGNRGEKHPLSRLTAAAVSAIRTEYAAGGVTQGELAERYQVQQSQISNIVTGKRWKENSSGKCE